MLATVFLAVLASALHVSAQSDSCLAAYAVNTPYGIHECNDYDEQNLYFTSNDTAAVAKAASDAICAAPKCPAANLTLAANFFRNACASDLADAGSLNASFLNTVVLPQLVTYDVTREANCLQATSNKSWCIYEFFEVVNKALGYQYNSTTLESDFDAAINASDPTVYCTDCVKAFTIATTNYATYNQSSFFSSNFQALGAAKCGASFLTGGIPATVALVANNATLAATDPPRNATDSLSGAASPTGSASASASASSGATSKASAASGASSAAATSAKSAAGKLVGGDMKMEVFVMVLLGMGLGLVVV